MNNVQLVGRIEEEVSVKGTDDGRTVVNLILSVPCDYKNSNGEKVKDYIEVEIWGGVAEATRTYCNVGDIVGIKGRLKTDSYENKDGTKKTALSVLAEKITFLSVMKDKDHDKER